MRAFVAFCLAGLVAGAFGPAIFADSDAMLAGVVIEEIPAGDPFEAADLQAGDRLLRWTGGDEEGDDEAETGALRTYWDWRYLVDEKKSQWPRVRLVFDRRGEEIERIVSDGLWEARVRPRLAETDRGLYQGGGEALVAGRTGEAFEAWEDLLEVFARRADRARVSWLAVRLAGEMGAQGDPARGRALLERVALDARGRREQALLLEERAVLALRVGDYAAAETDLQVALSLRRALGNELGTARTLYRLGYTRLRSGDPSAAEPRYLEALEIYGRLAPGSPPEAAALIGLGHASVLLGDLRAAQRHWRRSLAIYDRFAPDSGHRTGILHNLGTVAAVGGDLRRAEEYLYRALEAEQTAGVDVVQRARTLNNLGELASRRGDLERADELFREALEIKEAGGADASLLASTLGNLGHVALARGESEVATMYFTDAIERVRAASPSNLMEAAALDDRARAHLLAGDVSAAEDDLRRSLEILRRTAPEGLQIADTWRALAEVAERRGDLGLAGERLERAVAILERGAPGSTAHAWALGELAGVHRAEGDSAKAVALFERSLDALESQVGQLGGAPDVRDRFRAENGTLYRRHLELLAAVGRPADAFDVLERSRARGLLELLASRDLQPFDVPAELERRRHLLADRHDRLVHQLATASAKEEREPLVTALAALRREREELAETLRREAPRVAELRHPRPLGADEARAGLDRGTLLLAWSVGEERTILFAVRRDSEIRAVELPLGEETLGHRVDRFVRLIREGISGVPGPGDDRAMLEVIAGRLGEDLLGPVADEIAAADRLLLSPDGPLHPLPFAALRLVLPDAAPSEDDGGERFLVEHRPIALTPSATVLTELERRGGGLANQAPRVVAFGAPRLPTIEESGTSRLLDLAANLAPLPAAEREVRGVVDLFPGSAGHLGDEATEERVKALAPGVDVLHFATHALVDPDVPLESALVLSLPDTVESGEENGLLEAWEIFEEMRLDAELVVLSACGTALGRPVRGEGLVGLERAFHFAGARSVLASLWPVSDAATARLMERFYRHLRAGVARDEALRLAQIASLSPEGTDADGIDPSAPVHWAAFRLSGMVSPLVTVGE